MATERTQQAGHVKDLMRKGIDFEEWESSDYLRSILLGPLSGAFIIGGALDDLFTALFSGRVYGSSSGVPVMDNLKSVYYGAARVNKMKDKGIEAEDIIKTIDDLAEAASGTSKTLSLYSIAKREWKRAQNIFSNEKKSKGKKLKLRR